MDRLRDEAYSAHVKELLDRLEELEPTIRRGRRELMLARFRNAMAVVALVAFILAGVALFRVSAIDRQTSNEAKAQASASRHIADCINDVLGVRATTTTQETQARRDYAEAQKKFAVGQRQALIMIAARHPGAFDYLLAVEQAFELESDKFVARLDAIQRFRNAHPLGRC